MTIKEHGIQNMAAVAVAMLEFVNGTDVKLLINVDLLNWLIIKNEAAPSFTILKQNNNNKKKLQWPQEIK